MLEATREGGRAQEAAKDAYDDQDRDIGTSGMYLKCCLCGLQFLKSRASEFWEDENVCLCNRLWDQFYTLGSC